MDINGATNAAKQLMTNSALSASAPFITKKADWKTQITGIYTLLFPLIHKDFPVRLETIKYVMDRINSAVFDHCSTNRHNGAYSTPGIVTSSIPTQISIDQMEKLYTKIYKSANGTSTFEIKIKVPKTSDEILLGEIGYGV